MQFKRKYPACETLLLIEAVWDDGNVFAEDLMDCPECQTAPFSAPTGERPIQAVARRERLCDGHGRTKPRRDLQQVP